MYPINNPIKLYEYQLKLAGAKGVARAARRFKKEHIEDLTDEELEAGWKWAITKRVRSLSGKAEFPDEYYAYVGEAARRGGKDLLWSA